MKINKFLTIFLIAGTLTFSGCTSTPKVDHYTDATFSELQTDVKNTVCAVSGKRVMEQADVDNFNNLASRLEKYEGKKEADIDVLSSTIRATAENWSFALGKDLGRENAQGLTKLCDSLKEKEK